MRGIKSCSEFVDFTDTQLLGKMLTNDNAHSCIYLRHKAYCIKFLMSKGASENDAMDIYQDATIVLYEKIKNSDFKLTSSIQTYLNSICYFQFLSRLKGNYANKIILTEDIDESLNDWFEEETELVNERIEKLNKIFDNLKTNGDKCYERLRLFYYEKLTTAEIAIKQGLKNTDSVKSQISKCRNLLKRKLGI